MSRDLIDLMTPQSLNKDEIPELKTSLSDFLTEDICTEVGVVPIESTTELLILGAMNPDYMKVKELVQEITNKYPITVTLKQITPKEWERWFEKSKMNISNHLIFHQKNRQNVETNKILSGSIKDENLGTINSKDRNNYEKEKGSEYKLDKDDEALINLANTKKDYKDLEQDNDELIGEDLTISQDPLIAAVASILNKSNKIDASDIHVEPLEDRLRIRYRIDGMLKEIYSLPRLHINPVVSRLKIMSNLDIAEKRVPQDGRIRCLLNKRICNYRVSTLPGKWGEKVVLRRLESDASVLDLNKLITLEEELKVIRQMGSAAYGIVIVVGPTGSGKSTTLYSILSELNTPGVNISTVEDPVEYTLDGIHQVQVIREKGLDFAIALRALMRQDPDIILVGETRDKETAQTAMEAALTGHMVFTTLHANDTSTAITRLSEMGIPRYLVGASVIGVVAQRLVRKVCHKCSTTRSVERRKDELPLSYGIKKIRVPNIEVGYSKHKVKKILCTECGGSGYKGRVGIFEVLRINDHLRELIMNNSSADMLKQSAFKTEAKTLLDYGMELVKRELTTIEEVERVCLLEGES